MSHEIAAPESFLAQFGLTAFRPGQREVIATILSGRDCLCVMPTGGGKSLCFQLPAVMLDGLTLVVSPLIALMKDQVDQLQRLKLPVTFINSSLPPAEQFSRLDRVAAGEFRLVYVVPERFRSQKFLESVRAVGVKLLAVDEAHCISEWGHDFRPDYTRLGYYRKLLGQPPTIALTATATDQVRRDIVEQLDLSDPKTFITGFARPNLFYDVAIARSDKHKNDMLRTFLGATPGAGIIYASTRKKAEEVAELVSQTGRKTAVYHAGMMPDDRRAAQEAFMGGKYQVVAATNAFGMGIDKADVRFVVHYNMPGSIEAYYQEAGRAGRDGQPSRCMMLYLPADLRIQEFFIENAYPSREMVREVYEYLREIEANPIELTQQEIKEELRLPIGAEGVGNCEHLLEKAGVLERLLPSQNRAAVRIDSDLPTLVDLLPKQAKVRRRVLQAVERLVGPRRQEMVYFHVRELRLGDEVDAASVAAALRELNDLKSFTYVPPFRGRAICVLRRDLPFHELEIDFAAHERRKAGEYEKLARIEAFSVGSRCRQAVILEYFGEAKPADCGHCDNCSLRGMKHGHRDDPVKAKAIGDAGVAASSQAAAVVEPAPSADDERVIEAVRIVLSGVARTQAKFSCGRTLIAQMLRGSKNKSIEKLRLNKLSTYGLLADLKESQVVELIDALIAVDCLEQVEGTAFRPVVELTELGDEVMRGKAPLRRPLRLSATLRMKLLSRRLSRPDSEMRPRVAAETAPPAQDAGLPRAASDGPVMPPTSPTPPVPLPAPAPRSTEVGPNPWAAVTPRPPYYWTWRLLSAGLSAAECSAVRSLPPTTILAHVSQALDNGLVVRSEWVIGPDLLAALRGLEGRGLDKDVSKWLAALPAGTRAEEVAVYLRAR